MNLQSRSCWSSPSFRLPLVKGSSFLTCQTHIQSPLAKPHSEHCNCHFLLESWGLAPFFLSLMPVPDLFPSRYSGLPVRLVSWFGSWGSIWVKATRLPVSSTALTSNLSGNSDIKWTSAVRKAVRVSCFTHHVNTPGSCLYEPRWGWPYW